MGTRSKWKVREMRITKMQTLAMYFEQLVKSTAL